MTTLSSTETRGQRSEKLKPTCSSLLQIDCSENKLSTSYIDQDSGQR